MSLLGDLLAQTQIWATLTLLGGIAYLSFLIVYRSRYKSQIAWVMNVELATYTIVMGALPWPRLYGVDTTIALGLATWSLIFAELATIIVFSVNKSRGSRRDIYPNH